MRFHLLALFVLLSACGAEGPQISGLSGLEETAGALNFEVRSTCYVEQHLGSGVQATIYLFSEPDACRVEARKFLSEAMAIHTFLVTQDREALQHSMQEAHGKMPERLDFLSISIYSTAEKMVGRYDLPVSGTVSVSRCSQKRYENPECTSPQDGILNISEFESMSHISGDFNGAPFRAPHDPVLLLAGNALTNAILLLINSGY